MKKSIISSLLLLGCSLHAVESRIELRHREAGGVGYSTGYTSFDYFLMGEGESAEFLLDLRGHVFNNGRGAGNAGLGVRVPFKDDKYMLGANAFYDLRQSPGLLCKQVGAGLEWLSQKVDFRVNGYVPVGKQKDVEKKTFLNFAGTYASIRHKLHAALPSIDAEIGTPLPRPFYFALGAYYLFEQKSSNLEVGKAFGVRVRADVDWGRYISLGISATYDHIFKTRVQGIFSINIPFEKNWCKKKDEDDCEQPERRNLRRVAIMRNEIIPIQDKRKTYGALTNSNGDPIRFFFVDNDADINGDGSFERPFAALKDAERLSDPGDVIYVFPGDGTPKNMDEGIVLKEDQILASSAKPLVINDVVIPPQTPGITPIITNINPDQPIVTNPGNSRLDDFLFIPPWEYIFGRDNSSVDSSNARAAGYEVSSPEISPTSGPTVYGVPVFEDYQSPAPPAPVIQTFEIFSDYGSQ